MTTIPTITALPTPVPQTSDPTNFATRADTFLTALPTFGSELNLTVNATNTVVGEVNTNATAAVAAKVSAEAAAVAAIGTSTLMSTCSNSVTLSAGAKSLTGLQSGRTFANGQRATLVRVSDPTSQGSGIISGFSGGTTLTLTIDTVFGATGPFTDWLLVLSVFAPAPAPTTTEFSSAKNFALNAAVIF